MDTTTTTAASTFVPPTGDFAMGVTAVAASPPVVNDIDMSLGK